MGLYSSLYFFKSLSKLFIILNNNLNLDKLYSLLFLQKHKIFFPGCSYCSNCIEGTFNSIITHRWGVSGRCVMDCSQNNVKSHYGRARRGRVSNIFQKSLLYLLNRLQRDSFNQLRYYLICLSHALTYSIFCFSSGLIYASIFYFLPGIHAGAHLSFH